MVELETEMVDGKFFTKNQRERIFFFAERPMVPCNGFVKLENY
jgi:hypothetical protein